MKLGEELNVDIAKPRQQHVILLQHLIPGFVPAAHVTDEEVATDKVLVAVSFNFAVGVGTRNK